MNAMAGAQSQCQWWVYFPQGFGLWKQVNAGAAAGILESMEREPMQWEGFKVARVEEP